METTRDAGGDTKRYIPNADDRGEVDIGTGWRMRGGKVGTVTTTRSGKQARET
jgi:hypothetical protein